MNRISWVPSEDSAVVTNDGTCGRSLAVRPEQKSVVWMKDVIRSSRRPDKQSLTLVQVPLLH